MSKCTYCGRQIMVGRGITYVPADMKIVYFCGHKCRMNFFQGRKKKKWAMTLKENKKIIPVAYVAKEAPKP